MKSEKVIIKSEHDEFVELKARYKMAVKTAAMFREQYNELFDWLSDNEPEILNEFLDKD